MKRFAGYGLGVVILFALGLWLPDRLLAASDLYVANWSGTYGAGSIVRVSPSGSVSTFYDSELYGPNCLAFDNSGYLYQSDSDSGRIYKYSLLGAQSTFADGFSFPRGVTFDASGNLYVADVYTGLITKIAPDGQKSVFASGLRQPETLAFDSSGSLFVAEGNGYNDIVKFTPSGGSRSIFASGGFSLLDASIVFDQLGNLFVGDSGAGAVYKFTPDGKRSTFASGISPVALGCLAFDTSGNLYVAGGPSRSIYRFTPDGTRSTFASGLSAPGGLTGADGLAFGPPLTTATIALTNLPNPAIIIGGTGTVGVTVVNSASSGTDNLNYTLTGALQQGAASLGTLAPSSGTLSPGMSQSCTASITSNFWGSAKISLTATDPLSTNFSQSTTATLTVYDHANATLSSSIPKLTQTLSFGGVLRGANVPAQTFTIFNMAWYTTVSLTSDLKLTGFVQSGDAAFATNLAAFGGLTAFSGSNGNTFAASVNTANYTTSGEGTIAISASQLADDSSLPGARCSRYGLTIALVGNVGNATADATNSSNTFGPALTAQVASSGSYANLESTVKSTTGSGGGKAVGTTATILAGANSSAAGQTVNMQWQTRTTGADSIFASDILNLSGLALDGSGSGQTAPYVLQMSYDPSRYGANEAALAAAGQISLDTLDPNTGLWVNAVEENFGVNQGTFYDAPWLPGDLTPGDWGVNTATHTVWAVVNHDSQFAVVPEPSTLALLAAGFALAALARRRANCVPIRRVIHADGMCADYLGPPVG